MQLSRYLSNPIFKRATKRAKILMSNRFRLASLLVIAFKKLSKIEDKRKVKANLKEKIFLLGRLLKEFSSGKYKGLSWKSALSIVATFIYFINPADIIPDIIPISGLLDDFTILVWTYNSMLVELEDFKKWEMSNSEKT